MDINQAKLTIENAIKAKTLELEALTLAGQILTDTFVAEFTAKETAEAEANAAQLKINEVRAEKEAAVTAFTIKQEELESLRLEKSVLAEELPAQIGGKTQL